MEQELEKRKEKNTKRLYVNTFINTFLGLLTEKGTDNFGDEWTSKGMIINKQVHLVSTFKNGQKYVFYGALDAEKMMIKGYVSPKGSFTGTFAIEMK